jgi:CubicO group peptidase (beta-lactamase class C family)
MPNLLPRDLALRGLANRIDALISPWQGSGPGVSIGVVRGAELIALHHAGMASVEHAVPIGPRTRFRIASVSKQFTCAAVLLLAARGALDITAPVRSLLPELPEAYASVTVSCTLFL